MNSESGKETQEIDLKFRVFPIFIRFNLLFLVGRNRVNSRTKNEGRDLQDWVIISVVENRDHLLINLIQYCILSSSLSLPQCMRIMRIFFIPAT